MHLTATSLLLLLTVICLTVAGILSLKRTEVARTGLQGFSAFVTFAAVLLGTYWYFDRRPDAPKINLTVAATAQLLGPKDALLNIDLTIANVGLSALTFTKDNVSLYVNQVTPLSDEMRALLFNSDKSPIGRIEPNYVWVGLRQLKYPYTARIEAGETDHYYFRTVLRCEPMLTVVVQARIPKQDRGLDAIGPLKDMAKHPIHETWVVQSFIDMKDVCPAKGNRK